jgi:hypothetical protein
MWKKTDYYGVVAQAQDMVPGFKDGYRKFEQQVVLRGLSEGLLTNYGRNVAQLALYFGRCSELVSLEEINCYTRFATVSRRTCWKTALIYIRYNTCLATVGYARQSCIFI